jgi:hypothetical protein
VPKVAKPRFVHLGLPLAGVTLQVQLAICWKLRRIRNYSLFVSHPLSRVEP